ncbi:hypothetical protein ACPXCP_32515 [Streptomyces sp. DT20]|uniref:hypothetical protein n=1 Tax=Streptomyces sp. DT20 TaxID=3416519 RepID=UPI003CEFEF6D
MRRSEAAQVIGINVRTGKRWRDGRGVTGRNKAAPPINAVVPPVRGGSAFRPCALSGRSSRIHIADRPEMHVTHETVYQPLYVRGLGELQPHLVRELAGAAAPACQEEHGCRLGTGPGGAPETVGAPSLNIDDGRAV